MLSRVFEKGVHQVAYLPSFLSSSCLTTTKVWILLKFMLDYHMLVFFFRNFKLFGLRVGCLDNVCCASMILSKISCFEWNLSMS